MEQKLAFDYLVLAALAAGGVLFVAATLTASWLLRPYKPEPTKYTTYECGSEPVGPPWVQFRIGYYLYALLFVVFDIETAFLYPWAVAYGALPWFALVEMALFIGILVAGLAYAWKEGALAWR